VPVARVDAEQAARFSSALRRWFRRHGRALPWRATRDPYRVLVSEAMLQQTQVSRVLDYYQRFLTRFPTMEALATARPAAVRESWDGLGYYARARNLHAVARQVRELPSDPEQLRALPGIGAYTAGAVASFAFERRAALVDTNVARVLRRAFAPKADFKTTRGQRRLWAIAESVLPRTGMATWTHNQAIMELGALVCTARVAKCGECPVRSLCKTGLGKGERGKAHGNGGVRV
jgi:A/G-specific adenine glycosylase